MAVPQTISGNDEIIVRQVGTVGRFTLNRPAALNAVTHSMIQTMRDALERWRGDDGISKVIIDSCEGKAFAAGGDVRALYDMRDDEQRPHRQFWRDEYKLNALIANYPKPYVAIMDGITMGGGVGISAHGSHRIVTERARIAMPETAIGLIPDVGGSLLLAQTPGFVGVFLGLVGYQMSAADSLFAGFADYYIESNSLPDFVDDLVEGAAPLETVLARHAKAPGPSALAEQFDDIERIFRLSTIEKIIDALASEPGEWAAKIHAKFLQRSPMALKATLAAIGRAKKFTTIEQALTLEYRVVNRLFENGEFIEGVRALVIDKDRNPKWLSSRLCDVSDNAVAELLAPLEGGEELDLSTMITEGE